MGQQKNRRAYRARGSGGTTEEKNGKSPSVPLRRRMRYAIVRCNESGKFVPHGTRLLSQLKRPVVQSKNWLESTKHPKNKKFIGTCQAETWPLYGYKNMDALFGKKMHFCVRYFVFLASGRELGTIWKGLLKCHPNQAMCGTVRSTINTPIRRTGYIYRNVLQHLYRVFGFVGNMIRKHPQFDGHILISYNHIFRYVNSS